MILPLARPIAPGYHRPCLGNRGWKLKRGISLESEGLGIEEEVRDKDKRQYHVYEAIYEARQSSGWKSLRSYTWVWLLFYHLLLVLDPEYFLPPLSIFPHLSNQGDTILHSVTVRTHLAIYYKDNGSYHVPATEMAAAMLSMFSGSCGKHKATPQALSHIKE